MEKNDLRPSMPFCSLCLSHSASVCVCVFVCVCVWFWSIAPEGGRKSERWGGRKRWRLELI